MSKIPLRKNVLILVGAGYVLVLFVFVMLILAGGMKVAEAYDIINGPVMALIGGSLAIAKDLINADDESAAKQSSETKDGQNQDGGQGAQLGAEGGASG